MAYEYIGDSTNATNMTHMMQYANDVTGGALGAMMCFGIFIVVFIALKNYDTGKALAASSFISSICAILMFTMNMINDYVLILFIFLTVVSSLYTLFVGRT